MRKKAHTLLGYTFSQIVLMAVIGIAVAWWAGFLIGMVAAVVLPIVIGTKNHYSRRLETANLVVAMSDVSQLRNAYTNSHADEVIVSANCKIVFPPPNGPGKHSE